MEDETTDSSNQELVTLILCRVTQHLQVHEEFLGLYQVAYINAVTLIAAIKDVIIQLNLPLEKL